MFPIYSRHHFQDPVDPCAFPGAEEFHGGNCGRAFRGAGHRGYGGLPKDHQRQSSNEDPGRMWGDAVASVQLEVGQHELAICCICGHAQRWPLILSQISGKGQDFYKASPFSELRIEDAKLVSTSNRGGQGAIGLC